MERARLLLPATHLLLLRLLFYPGPQVSAGRPGCTTKCGDIDVPYPFGLEPQCAIHSGFVLNCTTVKGTAKLFHNELEVIRISVPDGKCWVKNWISRQCYDRANNKLIYNNTWINVTSYVLSVEDNKVIVLGCNSLAYMFSNPYTTVGCLSTCEIAPKNGSCTGAGCCQADLPRGVNYYASFFNDLYNNSDPRLATTPCNYVTVMERAAFNFTTAYLTTTQFWDTDGSRTPVVFEWAISRNTCEEAKAHKSYACVSSNSHCVTNDAGYLCNCTSGYRGNPYVQGGCTDIDECQESVTYPCAEICTNKPGSFDCSCSEGKTMLNGLCVKNQKSVVGVHFAMGVGIGMFLLLLVAAAIFTTKRLKIRKARKMREHFFKQNRRLLLQQLVDKDIAERMIFSLEEVEKATNKFDAARILGGGGHGIVYKGILSNQCVVAIKKSTFFTQREIDGFINEVAILSQINHRNVVKLFGCCLETEVPLLVYEFIPNGTLYDHLHVDNKQSQLPWKDRLRIATEVASSLAYLHSAASTLVVHRDIKTANILLDDRLTAKVSDFGASRGISIDQSAVTTPSIQGTYGYLDPEYFNMRRLTDKSDVYSYGVMLVELLTRKKPTILMSSEGVGLVAHFVGSLNQGKLNEILDEQVIEEGLEEVKEVAAIAAMCLRLKGEDRPTMRNVEMRLHGLHSTEGNNISGMEKELSAPNIRTFQEGNDRAGDNYASRRYSMEEEYLFSASLQR